jgi:transposase
MRTSESLSARLAMALSIGSRLSFTLGVEPTNNKAERSIREHVVQRKIIGTLRNEKRTSIHERLMTVLTTWSQQGLDSLQMLRLKLSS